MMFKSVAFLSALAGATASSVEVPTGDIKAGSRLGSKIMGAAKQLTPGTRKLDGEAGNWVASYSIRFEKCATSEEYYGGQFGGEQNNDNAMGMYQQRLVHFKLCPTDECSSSSCGDGADYVIDMGLFVEAYIESKLDAQEYNCEMVRENCNCDNANDDDACEWQCYQNAGLDYCEDNRDNNNGQNQIEFELERAAECAELDVDDEALQYYYYQQQQNGNGQQQYYNQNGQNQNQEQQLFVGPYCSANGKNIFLGVFMDEFCQYSAPEGTYEKFAYGQALPYSETSLIDEGCVSCKEPVDQDDQNNGDQQDADDVLEVCERLYEDAGKCESGLADGVTYYPNTYGCDFISSLKAPGKMAGTKSSVAASKVFAGLFAATTIVFGGVAYYLYNKAKRNNVQLASSDGGALA